MKKIILFLFLGSTVSIQAQQLPQFSQLTLNKLVFNPAIADSVIYPEIKLHNCSQWAGFKYAPITQTLGYYSELLTKMGLGGYFMNDIIGPTRIFSINNKFYLCTSVLQLFQTKIKFFIENDLKTTIPLTKHFNYVTYLGIGPDTRKDAVKIIH